MDERYIAAVRQAHPEAEVGKGKGHDHGRKRRRHAPLGLKLPTAPTRPIFRKEVERLRRVADVIEALLDRHHHAVAERRPAEAAS